MADPIFSPAQLAEATKTMLAKQRLIDSVAPDAPPTTMEMQPFSPKVAMLLGNLADSASTYEFLRNGRKKEANPALGVLNKHPVLTLPMGAAAGAGYMMLHKLLSKKSPKIADLLGGGIGNFHAALAGHNFERKPARPGTSDNNAYRLVLEDFKPASR